MNPAWFGFKTKHMGIEANFFIIIRITLNGAGFIIDVSAQIASLKTVCEIFGCNPAFTDGRYTQKMQNEIVTIFEQKIKLN